MVFLVFQSANADWRPRNPASQRRISLSRKIEIGLDPDGEAHISRRRVAAFPAFEPCLEHVVTPATDRRAGDDVEQVLAAHLLRSSLYRMEPESRDPDQPRVSPQSLQAPFSSGAVVPQAGQVTLPASPAPGLGGT